MSLLNIENKSTDVDPSWEILLRTTHTEELTRRSDTFQIETRKRTTLSDAWWQNVCEKLYARIQKLEARLEAIESLDGSADAILALAEVSRGFEDAPAPDPSNPDAPVVKRGRGRPRKVTA